MFRSSRSSKRPPNRWRRLLLALVAALALYQLSSYEVAGNLIDVWQEEDQVRQQIEALREENARIESAIEELSPEGSGVERIARQELGWAKPGEIVIKIPEKK